MLMRNVLKSTLAAALAIGTCNLAAAQYGGGGGMGGTGGGMPGSPTYNTHRSYSNKGAIAGGIAGGAALVGGLLYWHHNHTKLVGCLNGKGDKLTSDKDQKTYSLSDQQNETLKPGDRVELSGKKLKSDSGEPTFEVHKMNKDLGMCTTTSAMAR